MLIHVRRRHIKNGRRNQADGCPIALAIAEVVDGIPNVQPWYVQIGEKITDLPASANRFIARFDAGKPVKPFAFMLK